MAWGQVAEARQVSRDELIQHQRVVKAAMTLAENVRLFIDRPTTANQAAMRMAEKQFTMIANQVTA